MKYLILPLGIIIAIMIFGLIYNGQDFDENLASGYSSESINGTFTENSEEKSLAIEEDEYNFAIDETQGIIAIVIAVSIIGSLIGIQVLGSGLSEKTVSILYNTIFFYGIWALFSVFSLAYLVLIPVGGWVIYGILTGVYSFGINKQINGN